MNQEISTLLAAAGQAPSGDNTQPWRFIVAPDGSSVGLVLDESRDPSPMNAGQRMARIAVGAALENLLWAARAGGWTAEVVHATGPAIVTVHLAKNGEAQPSLADAISARVTNRRLYDGRPPSTDQLEYLSQQAFALDGVSTYWITEKARVTSLAKTIAQADGIMFGNPSMRRAFLANIRFDQPPNAQVSEGLSLGSLELSAADRLALRMMRWIPDWILKAGGAAAIFAGKARQLVESASGLCLIAAPDRTAETDLNVGRAMQRAWLSLTAMGLAAQPMMSLPVLENAVENGDPALIEALGRQEIALLGEAFRQSAPELETGRLAFLLRFGFAPVPTGRTGRLPLDAITSRGNLDSSPALS